MEASNDDDPKSKLPTLADALLENESSLADVAAAAAASVADKPVYVSSKLRPNHQYLVSPQVDEQDLKREPECVLYEASLMVDAAHDPDKWILVPDVPMVLGSEHYLEDQHLRFHYVYLVHPETRKIRACIGLYEYDIRSSKADAADAADANPWLVESKLLHGAKTLNLDKVGYPLLFPFVTESFLYKAGIPDLAAAAVSLTPSSLRHASQEGNDAAALSESLSSTGSTETEADDARIRKEYRQSGHAKSKNKRVWLQERYQNLHYEYAGLLDNDARQQTANLFDIVRTALRTVQIQVSEQDLRDLVARQVTDRDLDAFLDGGQTLRNAILEKLAETNRRLAATSSSSPTEPKTRLLHEKVMYMAQLKYLSTTTPRHHHPTIQTKDDFVEHIRRDPRYVPDPAMVVPILEREYEMKFIFLDGDRAASMPRSGKVASTSVYKSLAAESMFIDCEKSVRSPMARSSSLAPLVDSRRSQLYKTYLLVERETVQQEAGNAIEDALYSSEDAGLSSTRRRNGTAAATSTPKKGGLPEVPMYQHLFRLVSYKDRVLFTFDQLPYSLRKGIQARCRQHSAGLFSDFADFNRASESDEDDEDDDDDDDDNDDDDANAKDKQGDGGGTKTKTKKGGTKRVPPRRRRKEMRRKRQERIAASLPMMTTVQPDHAVLYVADFMPGQIPPGHFENEHVWSEDPMEGLKYSAVMLYPDWRHRLSDSWVAPFFLDGHRWLSVEHYVQAMKYKQSHPEFFLQFAQESDSDLSKDPRLAKIAGESVSGLYKKRYLRPSHIPLYDGNHPASPPILVWNMEGGGSGDGGGSSGSGSGSGSGSTGSSPSSGLAKEVTLDDLRERALRAKFTQNQDLMDLLVQTFDACIHHFHSYLGEFEPDLELLMTRSHVLAKYVGI